MLLQNRIYGWGVGGYNVKIYNFFLLLNFFFFVIAPDIKDLGVLLFFGVFFSTEKF